MLTKYPISEEAMYSVGPPPSNRSYLCVGSNFVIVKCEPGMLSGRVFLKSAAYGRMV
jgi:hypothetical protein